MAAPIPTGTSLGSPTLLLLPTELERARFADQGGLAPGRALVRLSGFGPVAAAARAAHLVATLRPRRVLLVGIAGTFDAAAHPVGEARVFERVAIDGVGAGEREEFRGPPALGFPQWPGSPGSTDAPVHDELALDVPAGTAAGTLGGTLLTTCAASISPSHARERRARHPDANAEDMEAFAVALACALARVPCTVVRGFSNVVGDRDPKRWRIPAALAAARRVVLELLDAGA